MQPTLCRASLILVALFAVICLAACGGSSAPRQQGPPPTFGTTPVVTAAEGQTYTYEMRATDMAGSVVTFSLTQAPAGAKLSNDTITWVPTAEQSRKPNQFVVTATTALGGKATQSWSVEPTGIIHVSWIDTYWDENGSTSVPFRTSVPISPLVQAFVPLNGGAWQTLSAVVGPTGTLDIAGVPSGLYWLQIFPRGYFWTSTSNFDFGSDFVSSRLSLGTGTSTSTTFNFNFDGLEAVPGSVVDVSTPVFGFSGTSDGSDTYSRSMTVGGNVDFSKVKTAYVMQYKPASFGSMTGKVLGATLTLSNLAWASGATNNVTGTLRPSPSAFLNVSIKGSQWASLFDHVGPAPAIPLGTAFELGVQPYLTLPDRFDPEGMQFTLFSPDDEAGFSNTTGFFSILHGNPCQGGAVQSGFVPMLPPVLLTDQDFGTVQYGDPYATAWKRSFSICQKALVTLAIPDLADPLSYAVSNGQTTVAPGAPVAPMISAVQNPKLNGNDLFTASTIDPSNVTLSWAKPAIGNPSAYTVRVLGPTTTPNGTIKYFTTATLATTGTSMTLPPGVLAAGKTYVLVITAVSDARANIETSPNRHGLPIANAEVVSAPITVLGQ